jgi:hypothetical protein
MNETPTYGGVIFDESLQHLLRVKAPLPSLSSTIGPSYRGIRRFLHTGIVNKPWLEEQSSSLVPRQYVVYFHNAELPTLTLPGL